MSDSHPAPGSWEHTSDKPSSSVSFAVSITEVSVGIQR